MIACFLLKLHQWTFLQQWMCCNMEWVACSICRSCCWTQLTFQLCIYHCR